MAIDRNREMGGNEAWAVEEGVTMAGGSGRLKEKVTGGQACSGGRSRNISSKQHQALSILYRSINISARVA